MRLWIPILPPRPRSRSIGPPALLLASGALILLGIPFSSKQVSAHPEEHEDDVPISVRVDRPTSSAVLAR
ncbi:MAG: hypothetical protein V3T81_00810 [Thermoanaerobaculia bacterium]